MGSDSPACVGLTPDVVEIDYPQSHGDLSPVLEEKGGSLVNVFLQRKSQATESPIPKLLIDLGL